MTTKWTRAQRKRHREETLTDTKPYIRTIFLSPKIIAKRKRKAERVAAMLLGKRIHEEHPWEWVG